MFKDKMTPNELADMTGYSRQTVNKWVREKNWETCKKEGVQGGRARFIYMSEPILTFIYNTRRMNDKVALYKANQSPLEQLMLNALRDLSETEQRQISSLLEREGLDGILRRLGIRK